MAGAPKQKTHIEKKRATSLHPKPAKAGRPPAHEIVRRQERILDIAMEEFRTEGFGGANIERIARKAGVSKATIYRNFGEKAALFEAIVRRTMGRIGNVWSRVTFDPADPEATVRAIARVSYEQWTSESLELNRIIYAEANRLPELARLVHDLIHDKALYPVTNYLQGLKENGILEFSDAFSAAVTLTTIAVGGTRFLLMPPSLTDQERDTLVEDAVQMFLRGTLAAPAGRKTTTRKLQGLHPRATGALSTF